jgi:hypothetical protein
LLNWQSLASTQGSFLPLASQAALPEMLTVLPLSHGAICWPGSTTPLMGFSLKFWQLGLQGSRKQLSLQTAPTCATQAAVQPPAAQHPGLTAQIDVTQGSQLASSEAPTEHQSWAQAVIGLQKVGLERLAS